MAQRTLGLMIAAHREAMSLIQQELAEKIGMTRENLSQLETGKRKEPLTPEQAKAIERVLGIPMLALVNAMGYPVTPPGFEDADEVAFLEAFRGLTRDQQRLLRAAVGLESPRTRRSPSRQRVRRIGGQADHRGDTE